MEETMGLLDSILGNMMGTGGPSTHGRGGVASPIVKTLLMLLATRAFQQHRSSPQGGSMGGGLGDLLGGRGGDLGGLLGGILGGQAGGMDRGGMRAGQGGPPQGGLGDLLGGLLGGGAAGGGLDGLLDQFRRNGYGDQADSWVGTGQNRLLSPDELSQALGLDTLDELEQQSGLPRQQLLSELSQELPDAVDQFTPDGRLPTQQEASSRWV
jgi:uncharacterized protein YidB (DUF937 family)